MRRLRSWRPGLRTPESGAWAGMTTKVQAARLATTGGTTVAIVDGSEGDVLVRLAQGEELGTLFPSPVDRMESRKRWMLSRLAVRGRIVVDAGAARALRKRSLLPAGVKEVEGLSSEARRWTSAGRTGRGSPAGSRTTAGMRWRRFGGSVGEDCGCPGV